MKTPIQIVHVHDDSQDQPRVIGYALARPCRTHMQYRGKRKVWRRKIPADYFATAKEAQKARL